ncbi:MAG TPA: lipoyl(octanoyl) transferase LipB [Gemmatimonadales bacterium]|nr:lipoyl(octanoyl) transferase LipB [Gemmatimonadales bacterium]
MNGGRLAVAQLGLVPYGEALSRQRALAGDRIAGRLTSDVLLLLEHPPVITLGRGTRETSLPIAPDALRRRGIDVFEIERGGDVTYHGPGQLVGYPIFDLAAHRKDLHWFLRRMEEALFAALARFGITGERREGYTGAWTGGRKIASIGIHVRQWVTWHGFALNVTDDLSAFDLIVPCGIPGVVMTSVAKELAAGAAPLRPAGDAELMRRTREAVVDGFVRTFGFGGVEAFDPATTAA